MAAFRQFIPAGPGTGGGAAAFPRGAAGPAGPAAPRGNQSPRGAKGPPWGFVRAARARRPPSGARARAAERAA